MHPIFLAGLQSLGGYQKQGTTWWKQNSLSGVVSNVDLVPVPFVMSERGFEFQNCVFCPFCLESPASRNCQVGDGHHYEETLPPMGVFCKIVDL